METARKAMEKAQELFSDLEKKARLAVGLARKIGQRMEQQREAERQRQELARQDEIKRQQDIRATEEGRRAVEKNDRNRPSSLSRGRSRGRGW